MFLTKRDKLLRRSWKHGIVGVEIPDDPNSSIYKEEKTARESSQHEKDQINDLRKKRMVKHGGTSSQVDFARDSPIQKVDKQEVAMYPEWKSKRSSKERYQDTGAMFKPLQGKH